MAHIFTPKLAICKEENKQLDYICTFQCPHQLASEADVIMIIFLTQKKNSHKTVLKGLLQKHLRILISYICVGIFFERMKHSIKRDAINIGRDCVQVVSSKKICRNTAFGRKSYSAYPTALTTTMLNV